MGTRRRAKSLRSVWTRWSASGPDSLARRVAAPSLSQVGEAVYRCPNRRWRPEESWAHVGSRPFVVKVVLYQSLAGPSSFKKSSLGQ